MTDPVHFVLPLVEADYEAAPVPSADFTYAPKPIQIFIPAEHPDTGEVFYGTLADVLTGQGDLVSELLQRVIALENAEPQ